MSPSAAAGVPHGNDGFHPTLSNFLDFIKDGDITISPQVEIQELEGRGLGVVAAQRIKPGTELMWVPTSAILQPSSVPESFIPLALRGRDGEASKESGEEKQWMRTHALLAAWIAFGNCQEHEAWMATWPSLDEMEVGMPICWPEAAKGLVPHASKFGRKNTVASVGKEPAEAFTILPWDVGGMCATVPSNSEAAMPSANGKKLRSKRNRAETSSPPVLGLLAKQQEKFDFDLRSVRDALPYLAEALEDIDTREYASFMHAWLIVNSRCFYYVPTGSTVPEDSDEAMALCPVVDIFNHNDGHGGGCNVSHNDESFTVKVSTERTTAYQEGEELFVSYGSHGSDMLWVEYGFLLDQNKWDSVTIPDQVILKGLSTKEREMLEEKGYLGGYTMRDEGACWRTEVASWLRELTCPEWEEIVDGLWYPEESEDDDGDPQNRKNSYRDTPRRRVMKRIVNWVEQARHEAENSLRGMMNMNEIQLAVVFGDDETTSSQRFGVTLQRWRQIWTTCTTTLRSIEADCPGAFLVSGQAGRSLEDLHMDIEGYIEQIRTIPNGRPAS